MEVDGAVFLRCLGGALGPAGPVGAGHGAGGRLAEHAVQPVLTAVMRHRCFGADGEIPRREQRRVAEIRHHAVAQSAQRLGRQRGGVQPRTIDLAVEMPAGRCADGGRSTGWCPGCGRSWGRWPTWRCCRMRGDGEWQAGRPGDRCRPGRGGQRAPVPAALTVQRVLEHRQRAGLRIERRADERPFPFHQRPGRHRPPKRPCRPDHHLKAAGRVQADAPSLVGGVGPPRDDALRAGFQPGGPQVAADREAG